MNMRLLLSEQSRAKTNWLLFSHLTSTFHLVPDIYHRTFLTFLTHLATDAPFAIVALSHMSFVHRHDAVYCSGLQPCRESTGQSGLLRQNNKGILGNPDQDLVLHWNWNAAFPTDC